MLFVQFRRSLVSLCQFLIVVAAILVCICLFGNVTLSGAEYRTVDYRDPSTGRVATVMLLRDFDVDTEYWSAFPWGTAYKSPFAISPSPDFNLHRTQPKLPRLEGIDMRFLAQTPLGTFFETDHFIRPDEIRNADDLKHARRTYTISAPDGSTLKWRDEFKVDGLSVFGISVILPALIHACALLLAIFGILMGAALGDDIANHLAIVRTRPIGQLRFALAAIGIDVAFLTIAVGIVSIIVVTIPDTDLTKGLTAFSGIDASTKALGTAAIWALAVACYGLALALTMTRKRVAAVAALLAVVVVQFALFMPNASAWPRPLAVLTAPLAFVNPLIYYSKVLFAMIGAMLFPSVTLPAGLTDTAAYNLAALLVLAVLGTAVGVLRWGAARI